MYRMMRLKKAPAMTKPGFARAQRRLRGVATNRSEPLALPRPELFGAAAKGSGNDDPEPDIVFLDNGGPMEKRRAGGEGQNGQQGNTH